MTRAGFMRFVLWADSHHDKGARLTPEQVSDHWRVSRATAYRLLADYFDAKGWQWPTPRETALPAIKSQNAVHPWRRLAA